MALTRLGLTLLLFVGGLVGYVVAQESVSLTTPIVKTATSSCALDVLTLDVTRSAIFATLRCNNGDVVQKTYDGGTTPTGASLLTTLNRGNFTTNSLIKAVYNRLIADGVIVGTVAGTPQ
jgi:hypothetical protein